MPWGFSKMCFCHMQFGPFVVQHQLIDVITSFTTFLIAQLYSRSSSLCAYNYASMGLSFTLFSIIFGMGSLFAMTKVSLYVTIVVCFT